MLTVQNIFDLGIKMGIASDPRGAKGVKRYLDRIKKEYDNLSSAEKPYYDIDNLTNPYPDSKIHVDNKKTNVKRVLAGIDIGAAELIVASQLNERGKYIDLAIAHHPVGKALASLHEVMHMEASIFESHGVPVHLAEKITEDRMGEVGRNVHGSNHYQAVNIAELLGINFINTHTFTDNLVDKFLTDYITKRNPETLGDMLDVLMEIPEYQAAKRLGQGPKLFAGNPSNRVGRWIVEMTGGTEPSSKIYSEFSHSGISTIVGMHMRKDSLDKVHEMQLNVVTAGHMSSDSLGMNLFLDELEKKGVEIVPCGGLIRVSRAAKKAKKQ